MVRASSPETNDYIYLHVFRLHLLFPVHRRHRNERNPFWPSFLFTRTFIFLVKTGKSEIWVSLGWCGQDESQSHLMMLLCHGLPKFSDDKHQKKWQDIYRMFLFPLLAVQKELARWLCFSLLLVGTTGLLQDIYRLDLI